VLTIRNGEAHVVEDGAIVFEDGSVMQLEDRRGHSSGFHRVDSSRASFTESRRCPERMLAILAILAILAMS
jgi:hypothetical protein